MALCTHGIEGGGYGQNDVLQPVFQAWHKAENTGRCLDATLAILAVTCSQAFYCTDKVTCPPLLTGLLDQIRSITPPVTDHRELGTSVGALSDFLSDTVYQDCCV